MTLADFDELEARLREVRALVGIDPTRIPQGSGPSDRPTTTLRVPRIGWDLFLLAAAWASLLSFIITLVA